MNFQQTIQIYTQLGAFFKHHATQDEPVFRQAYLHNNWFTDEYVKKAVFAWGNELTETKLNTWLTPYQTFTEPLPKRVAIIMAGNIPLVGLHDLLAVLACGHTAVVKLSSDDTHLMKWIINALITIAPQFESRIEVTEERLPKNFDAVIATGSNNTYRYFEHYFKGKPSLLRKSRTSLAVLTGNETPDDLVKLGEDIFTYFGLGCRTVSKIFVPHLATFYEGIEGFAEHINHHKYANNYTYHKAILLMNLTKHLDNNFLLIKEDENLASPLGVLNYQFYNNLTEVTDFVAKHADEIQCVVSKQAMPNSVPLGKAQQPELADYADGVDTVKFLLAL
jgi:hypothetical protein